MKECQLNLPLGQYVGRFSEDDSSETQEYVFAEYRMLSAILLPDRFIDFSKPGVLEKSVPLGKGLTIYRDHRAAIDGWCGVVMDTYWDQTGIPGMNGKFRVDAVKEPMIARGVSSTPPAIHSCSVSVSFLWEKSHPDMRDWKFFENLGEEVDGNIVRLVVQKILGYNEVSFVYQGADPYAKQLSREERIEELRKATGTTKLFTQGKDFSMDENKTNQEERKEEIMALKGLIEELKTEKAMLEKDAEIGKKYHLNLQKEVNRLILLVEGENGKTLAESFQKAGTETLEEMQKAYQLKADEKFGWRCNDCGGTNVLRKSSIGFGKNEQKPRNSNQSLAQEIHE